MKKDELLIITKKIFATYANFYPTEERRKEYSEVLYDTIRKEDFKFIEKNLINHIRNSKFPPSPADLLAAEGDEVRKWGTPVVIEEVPEKTPEEIERIKAIIAEGKKMLAERFGGHKE